jgi:caffeoyl-CoA O-methyltransferase
MEFIPENIDRYVSAHSQEEPELLQKLNRETWTKVLQPRMLSGHFQGRVLSMISKLIRPQHILEIGTYTGYSALCFAEGMQPDSQIHTIDINEELYDLQRKYFDLSGKGDQIIQHVGNAIDIIPTLDLKFDLAFIDADKSNYPQYFELILPKMNSGGVILSDNVLWSGKVVEPLQKNDVDTAALITYNQMINQHPAVETVLLPIRDGLTITRVK